MVRVRYAPSPTGDPHLGNIRTAFFNFLFARQEKGRFILRIEDTDRKRLVPGTLERIEESLQWLGITWDEGPGVGGNYGPYIQSERLDLYRETAEKLIIEGKAYYCFCTPQRLEEMRKSQEARHEPPRYDRACLGLSPEDVTSNLEKKAARVVRLKVPGDDITVLDDLIRGRVEFQNKLVDDQVLLKSDGFPTYHLAVVVDDHAMQITHVIRGDEWLSSAPKHLMLYSALGWEAPKYAHLPTILGPDKSKLSKRHGAQSVLFYRSEGYLSEALVNFIALLGWSPKNNRETFSLSELVETFSLEHVQKSPAIFDQKKLDWFNGYHIRLLKVEELTARLRPFVPNEWPDNRVQVILPLVKDRMVALKDFVSLTEFFFEEPEVSPDLFRNYGTSVRKVLIEAGERLGRGVVWEHDAMEKRMRTLAEELSVKPGDLFMIVRIALTGKTVTPPLFETMLVLGQETVYARLKKASDLV